MKGKKAGIKKMLRAAAFLILFAAVFCVVSYVLRPYSGSASRKNLCGFYAEEDNTLDIVYIGSSACFTFWEPMEFWNDYGVTSYDFATGTMPPQVIKYCMKEIKKTQDPSLYIVDLRPFSVAETGYYQQTEVANMDHEVPLRYVIDNFKYSSNRNDMIENCLPESENKISYYFDLIRYHTEWPRLLDPQSWHFWRNEAHDSLKGFKLVPKVDEVKFEDYSWDEERKQMSERLDPVFRDLLDYCKEENLQVLFIVNSYCQTKEHKEMFNYASDVIAEYGFDFLNTNDYYKEIGLDYNTDFYDRSHVNIFGADKYTDFVGSYLMDHYSFEDKRGQAEYSKWDEDYIIWTQETEALKETIQEMIDTK